MSTEYAKAGAGHLKGTELEGKQEVRVNTIQVLGTLFWVSIACFTRKRLPAHERYAMIFFTAAFAMVFDLMFGLMFDLYDYGRSGNLNWEDMLQIMVANPAITLVFLNFLPKHLLSQLLYVAGWVALLTATELIWYQFGGITYKGWNIWYSMLAYPGLLGVLIGNLYYYRHLVAKR